eukprot:scpid100934/ scgid19686/ 
MSRKPFHWCWTRDRRWQEVNFSQSLNTHRFLVDAAADPLGRSVVAGFRSSPKVEFLNDKTDLFYGPSPQEQASERFAKETQAKRRHTMTVLPLASMHEQQLIIAIDGLSIQLRHLHNVSTS